MSYDELYKEDKLLRDALTVILTDNEFLEYAQEFTVDFIDNHLDTSDEKKGNLRWLFYQQEVYKDLRELAYKINPQSIDKDDTYKDFVEHEQNLVEMLDFLKENKDEDGVYYSEDILDLSNFITNTFKSE